MHFHLNQTVKIPKAWSILPDDKLQSAICISSWAFLFLRSVSVKNWKVAINHTLLVFSHDKISPYLLHRSFYARLRQNGFTSGTSTDPSIHFQWLLESVPAAKVQTHTHTHTFGQFRDASWPHLHIIRLWEDANYSEMIRAGAAAQKCHFVLKVISSHFMLSRDSWAKLTVKLSKQWSLLHYNYFACGSCGAKHKQLYSPSQISKIFPTDFHQSDVKQN